MNDLQFTIVVANEEQRKIDDEALSEDIDKYIKKIDDVHDAIKYLKDHMNDKSNGANDEANVINSKDLEIPLLGAIERGKNKMRSKNVL